MNDEHREDPSVTGWSSGGNGTSTATAEPIDRRWFEEALRAQGFLVEAPTTDDEVTTIEPRSAVLDTGPTDAALHDEPAAVAGQPFPSAMDATTALSRPETVGPEHAGEPWDLPSSRSPVASVAKPLPVSERVPGWPRIGDTPSRVASATTGPAPTAPSAAPPSPTARQAVAPTTLPEARPPVPTPELAARLARSTSRPMPAAIEGTAPAAPVAIAAAAVESTSTFAEPAASLAPLASTSVASPAAATETVPVDVAQASAIVAAATAPAAPSTTAVNAADPWTLPALQADLAAERRSGSATADDLAPFVVAAATAPVVAVASPAAPAPGVASPVLLMPVADDPAASTAEATARQEADLQAQAVASDIVTSEPSAAPVPADQAAVPLAPNMAPVAAPGVVPATQVGSITDIDVAPAPAEDHDDGAMPSAAAVASGSPGTRPAAGIAAVAHRPPATMAATDTPVDGGDSDLWGLVDDPRKAAADATTTTRPTAGSRVTTLILTVFVAIVVVVLVLGFLYLLGQLV